MRKLELNKVYKHFKGDLYIVIDVAINSETDKKIARMSCALACMLCNTDDYENVKLTKSHVDVIVEFLGSVLFLFKLISFPSKLKVSPSGRPVSSEIGVKVNLPSFSPFL